MGVLSHKDIFNSKWITAKISDAGNRLWFVPIQHVLGEYFLAEIEGLLYCFRIEGERIKTYRHTLIKSFRLLDYDINHYRPVSPSNLKDLENMLRVNNLPKMNMTMFGMLKALGKREKDEFTPHDIKLLIDNLSDLGDEYKAQAVSIKNYLEHLNVDQIVSPVRKITEFIEDDLIETDPQFLGTITSAFQRMDMENKKITNTPITGKKPWIKVIAILVICGLVAGIGYWIYDSGVLEGAAIPGLGNQGKPTIEEITAKYSPEELRAAIDRGEINYKDLPKEVQKMVDSVKLPTVKTD